jgi:hypothetical protein
VQAVVIAQDFHSEVITDTIPINFSNSYSVSGVSVIPFSQMLIVRGTVLSPGDYTFQYDKGIFSLSDSLAYSVFDTIIISYKAYKTGLKKEYKKRSLVLKYDEEKKDSVRLSLAEGTPLSTESIFGSGIEKSGTLVRGFTVGTTKDFSLQSGLRLQLSGKLSEDLEIVAALTDENTPIQPEGNTERLEELDKVFIQVKHTNAAGTFGDYQLQKKFGEFGAVDRKLQGLLGEFNFSGSALPGEISDRYSGYAAVASSRGKFNTNNFNGSDGVQGPYRLSGIDNTTDIIIIAGTEKVYLDGIEMRRGENNDYVIEYANAEITFTTTRLITSASRIVVDFEYTDRRYSRTFFGAGTETSFLDDRLTIGFQYMREGDDQDAPIDITLDDDDKALLQAAGDNRDIAVKSGVALATPDSLGNINGTYIKVDTLINDSSFSYYVYSPGDTAALYNVSFSYVGSGEGDYTRESLGNFKFVGIGQGTYIPLIYIPLPELKQTANFILNAVLWEDVKLSVELSGSLWDKNRLSTLDDDNNGGYARNLSLTINPREIKIGSVNFGKAGFSYRDRFMQDRFTSIDRINAVEFSRYYNVDTDTEEDEELREIGLTLIPVNNLNINSSLGLLRRGDEFKSNRYNNTLGYNDSLFSVKYNLDYVESENLVTKSYWFRQSGTGSYQAGIFKPGIEFLAEDRKDKTTAEDSIISGSLRYHEVIPFLSVSDIFDLNLSAKYSFREDYSPVNGRIIKDSRSITQYYELNYSGSGKFNTTFNFTLRNKNYTDEYKLALPESAIDDQTILVRSQSKFNFIKPVTGDLFYEVSTERSAKLQRVFIAVDNGNGNYNYTGDLNNNGVKDEYEFEPTIYEGDYILVTVPTDQLYPVIDLKTSTRWKINYGGFFDQGTTLSKLLKPVSTETTWRVEENTREEDYSKIYLLQFSAFQNEVNTISGTNYFLNDLHIWENSQELSFRLRYSQRKSLNQYSGGFERAYARERSLRIKFKLVKEIANETNLVNESDNVGANITSNRRRQIDGNSMSTDFSYRPENYVEVGFKIKVERREDVFPEIPTVIDGNSLMLRLNFSFEGKGRLRVEIERNELTANTTENYIPYELTNGNTIGKNYFWRLNFDYRISSNLQSTLSYDGRLQGGGKAINTLRAEARAYF